MSPALPASWRPSAPSGGGRGAVVPERSVPALLRPPRLRHRGDVGADKPSPVLAGKTSHLVSTYCVPSPMPGTHHICSTTKFQGVIHLIS